MANLSREQMRHVMGLPQPLRELPRSGAKDGEGMALAEGVGFEPTRERNPLPVFKTGALNHSATLPLRT